jgi:hypothetical protein
MRALSLSRDGLSPVVVADILAARLGETGDRVAHLIRRAMRSYLQTRNGRSAFFHRALMDAARRRYARTAPSVQAEHAAIARALSHAWSTKRDIHAMAERLHHLVEAGDWDSVLQLLRDHASLGEMIQQSGGGRLFALDVDFAYQRANADVASPIVDAFLALLASRPARDARFDIDRLNAWLLYGPNQTFLRAVLEAGARPSVNLPDLDPQERDLAFSSRIRLGGVLRREGRLAEAEAMLLGLFAVAGLRSAVPPRAIGRLAVRLRSLFHRADERASILTYELGYIAFLRGELPLARRWFRHSYALGRAAKDPTRAWISRCLAENSTFVATRKTRRFENSLVRARRIFEHHASLGDPNAQRWVMNAAAHRLEIAVSRGDANATREMHAALLSDAWVRQIAPAGFMLRYDALLALAERRFADAVAAFDSFLGGQTFGPGNRYEQLARHALDYGRALLGAGDRNRAAAIWRDALTLPPDAGNRPWQQQIQSLLGNAG